MTSTIVKPVFDSRPMKSVCADRTISGRHRLGDCRPGIGGTDIVENRRSVATRIVLNRKIISNNAAAENNTMEFKRELLFYNLSNDIGAEAVRNNRYLRCIWMQEFRVLYLRPNRQLCFVA